MSTHKHIDRICALAVALSVLLCLLFMNAPLFGISAADTSAAYSTRLFDTERVHSIDIVMDDWDSFIASAQSEEYSPCTVVIDGESYANVGIRGKGNTSLSTVSSMDSQRYSFKLEFDQYDSGKSYYGLDKLSLNNIIQDSTYMKDYLTYRLMAEFGAAAPLCSYVFITVNGEDWGLYLAVEGVEDAFLQRNYGSDHGELYKPDSMDMGGGRGNGKGFDADEFFAAADSAEQSPTAAPSTAGGDVSFGRGGNRGGDLPTGTRPDGGGDFSFGGFGGGGMGAMGSSDVLLQYSGDDASNYSNIFDNAKTDVSEADQSRLIASLKTLSEGTDITSVVDIDAVLRYFVVHNFVVNGDSYTGSMIHNYYLYEHEGVLSMIPWDYNLAYGTFQGGNASGSVNDPIDTPLSVGSGSSRPMIDWIFQSAEYTELYHQYFSEFLEKVDVTGIIDSARELISPYVERDPSAFYSYEEFEKGADTLRSFCTLRSESVQGQLQGTIPSTDAGQAEDSSALVDTESLTLSDMGTMNMGGGGRGGDFDIPDMELPEDFSDFSDMTPPEGFEDTEMPDDFGGMPFPGGDMSQMPGGMGQIPQQPGSADSSRLPQSGGESSFAPSADTQQPPGMGSGVLILLSVLVLAAALIIVLKYKR